MATPKFLLSKLVRGSRSAISSFSSSSCSSPCSSFSSSYSISTLLSQFIMNPSPNPILPSPSSFFSISYSLSPHNFSFTRSLSTWDSDDPVSVPTQSGSLDLGFNTSVDGDGGDGSEIAEALSEVSGVDSKFSVRALTSILDAYHDLTGLPWWIVIVSSTLALRIALFPLLSFQLHKLKKIGEFLPKLPRPFPPPFSGRSYVTQFSHFMKEKRRVGCPSLLWFISYPSVQIPCFLLGVTTIRRMSLDHHAGFDSGGTLWFQNLTLFPHGVSGCVFPLLIIVLHIANTRVTFKKISIQKMNEQFKLLARSYKFCLDGLILPMLFFAFYIPQGSLVYWVTNSSFTLIQQLCMDDPKIRKHLGLPEKKVKSATVENLQEFGVPEEKLLDTSGTEQKVYAPNLSPKELVNLSIQLLAKGHKDRAIPMLRLVLDKDPEHIRALIVMGQTLLQKGLPAEATEYLDRAVSRLCLNGPSTDVEVDQLIVASQWAGVAHIRQGRSAKGIVHLERIGSLKEPEDAKHKAHYYDGLLMLASALTNEGREAEAEKYLRVAAAYDSTYNVYLEQLQSKEDNFVSDLANSKRKNQSN